MNKIFSILFFLGLILTGIFQYTRNLDVEVNYERFNLVSPGVLRTPEERFKNLKDYDFKPNYLQINGLRIHYLDEGPKDGEVIFLLHGQPAWSYLFRKMIPTLVDAGYRVIAPDMVGFGKSDKYINIDDYSHQMHVDIITNLIRELDLKDMTAHVHDWGGLVGLRVVAEEPDRFSRVIASNTGLIAPGRGLINDIRGFFLGPIFGAILFTLLQTVIGLQTDLWALYTGLVFILMVMFLPAGLTGLFAMHMIPIQLGRFGMLIKPYSKIFLPGVAFVIGTIALIELINHVRHHGEEQFMTLFWIEFDTTSYFPWALLLILVGVGFYFSRILSREVAEAWGEATFVEGERR